MFSDDYHVFQGEIFMEWWMYSDKYRRVKLEIFIEQGEIFIEQWMCSDISDNVSVDVLQWKS